MRNFRKLNGVFIEDLKLKLMLQKFKENNPNKELILLYQAGSHFFDLQGPKSDTDYRGLYLDLKHDSFLSSGKIHQIDYKTKLGNGKNDADDVDFTIFSLSSFLKLLKMGDFNMMELLYVPENKIIFKTPLFDELVEIRDQLIVNDISAFLGFIKTEYKTYGVNIYHHKMQEDFLLFLSQFPESDRMNQHWKEISDYVSSNEGLKLTTMKVNNSEKTKEIPGIVIAQRLHGNTETIKHVTETIRSILDKYGHRQKEMSENGNNFKGLYHALRLIYEARDIFSHDRLIFPFDSERMKLLRKIKDGHIKKDELFAIIDAEILELKAKEGSVISNRPLVERRIEKLEMILKGRMSLANVFKNLA